MNRIYKTFILLFCLSFQTNAQDIHFSQFYNSTVLNNPGMVGIFNDDIKGGVIYRSQWNSITTPFVTSVLDVEAKFHVNKVNDYVSFALLGYSDKAGAINFQTQGFYPAINYNKSLEDQYNSYLSVGFTGGYITRNVDISKMTFDNQYVGGNFDPTASTGEQITQNKVSYWDLGAGITFNSSLDPENKINYVVGAAGYHFTTPQGSFFKSNANAPIHIRWDANVGLDYEINETYAVQLYGNVMIQSPYKEIIGGALARWTKQGNTNSPPFSLFVGAFYRAQDAWIPTLKLEYKNKALTCSYDLNTSSLKSISNMHGGFELSFFISGSFINGPDDKHLCPRF